MPEFGVGILVIVAIIALSSIKQVNEYERGLLYVMGHFVKVLKPGWHVIWPIFQSFQKVDIRTKAVDVPEQEAITRDNVSIKINAVLYYNVAEGAEHTALDHTIRKLDNGKIQVTVNEKPGTAFFKFHMVLEVDVNGVINCKEGKISFASLEKIQNYKKEHPEVAI